jgi:hypothetical protein
MYNSNTNLSPIQNKINCENYVETMFKFTLIPYIHKLHYKIKYPVIILIDSLYMFSLFCKLFYSSYYINQPEIWTFDLCLSFVIYNILLYLRSTTNLFMFDSKSNINVSLHNIKEESYYEEIKVYTYKHVISIIFYWLYMVYWLYFAIYMLYVHNDKPLKYQFANVLMFFAWYLFFSEMALLYYYICVKLSARFEYVKEFLKEIKTSKPNVQDFSSKYFVEYKKTRLFAKKWNFIIYIGFILLSFHIPVDLISILIGKKYYDIPGFIIKTLSLIWYTYCICNLNNLDNKLIKYLNKHQLFHKDDIDELNNYIQARPLGIDLYGFKLNGNFIIQLIIIIINFILPIIYGLVSNNIIN